MLSPDNIFHILIFVALIFIAVFVYRMSVRVEHLLAHNKIPDPLLMVPPEVV